MRTGPLPHASCALALLLLGASAGAQTLDARGLMTAGTGDEAAGRAAFERGVGLAERLQWSEAAEAFEESYRRYPRAATLRNLGLAHRALGRFTSAIDELGRFLREANPAEGVRQQLQGLIDEMMVQLAVITVSPSVESATMAFDGVALEALEARAADPGDHVLSATADGYARTAQTVRLTRGEHRRMELVLQRADGGLASRWWFWTIVGVAVAGAATATVLLLSTEAPPNCGSLQLCLSP
jgi:tetratricopeptide (TPR) repeat protein